MLRVIRDDIVLTSPEDIISLILALKKPVYFTLKHHHFKKEQILIGIGCLDRSLTNDHTIHQIDEVKSAFLSLSHYVDREDLFGNELYKLTLKAFYTWNWLEYSPAYYMDIFKLIIGKLAIVFSHNAVEENQYHVSVKALNDMVEFVKVIDVLFVQASLAYIANQQMPHWGIACKLLKRSMIINAIDSQLIQQELCLFGKKMWIIWGPDNELILLVLGATSGRVIMNCWIGSQFVFKSVGNRHL